MRDHAPNEYLGTVGLLLPPPKYVDMSILLVDAHFKCSFRKKCKSPFFRAFNAMYDKIGRSASEETILELLRAKCLPTLLYATETCPLLSRDKHSLEFTLTRVHENLLHRISRCRHGMSAEFFCFLPVTSQIVIRTEKFLQVFVATDNSLCQLFHCSAVNQSNDVLCKYNVRILQVSLRVEYLICSLHSSN